MIENELLFAMSTLLDTKLEPIKADISNIKQEIVEMKADINNIKQEMVEMKADISNIKQEMVEMKADISNIKQEIVEMKADISNIKQEIVVIKADISNIKQEIVVIKADIHKINLKMENDFEPKLQLLAENYVPAAKRYESEADKMETMRVDIDIMKKVITEHSEKIQMLA